MALLTHKLEELIPLFPAADHKKLEAVYRKIPGSLLKFIDPTQITKKVDSREDNLEITPSMLAAYPESPMHSVPPARSSDRNAPQYNYPYQDPYKGNQQNLTQSYSPVAVHPDPYPVLQEHNKYRAPLKMLLVYSITERFNHQRINDISPNLIGQNIVKHCFAQGPDWGRYRSKERSTIVRFNENFISEGGSQPTNINVHVYAFLKFEYSESLVPWKNGQQPRISFELTIELNGTAIDRNKIIQISDLLNSSDSLEKVIEKVESISKVAWENLADKGREKSLQATQSPPRQSKLSWDDL